MILVRDHSMAQPSPSVNPKAGLKAVASSPDPATSEPATATEPVVPPASSSTIADREKTSAAARPPAVAPTPSLSSTPVSAPSPPADTTSALPPVSSSAAVSPTKIPAVPVPPAKSQTPSAASSTPLDAKATSAAASPATSGTSHISVISSSPSPIISSSSVSPASEVPAHAATDHALKATSPPTVPPSLPSSNSPSSSSLLASSSDSNPSSAAVGQLTPAPGPAGSSEAIATPSALPGESLTEVDGRLQSTASVSTSTITIHPDSTFAHAVSVPVTVSGHTTITAPPFITSVAVTTLPDGQSVTITHVVANPTGGLSALNGHSFFNNHAAVIGVFLVTGIAIACLSAISFCLFRRRRRRTQGRRLLDRSPTPVDPFADPREDHSRAMYEHGPSSIRWDMQRLLQRSGGVDDIRVTVPEPVHIPSQPRNMTASSGVGSTSPTHPSPYEGPFSDYHPMHMRVTTPQGNQDDPSSSPDGTRSPSRAQSSPSVYPPSLPGEEADSLYEKELRLSHPPLAPTALNARSADGSNKGRSTESPTTSSTSHGSHLRNSPFESPISENGTMLSSILDGKTYRTFPLPEAPPDVFLRRTFSKRMPLNELAQQRSVGQAL
ncbi:hypothetical protein BV25DRAFT_539364 [Artomyces pyxidatus]|uniref:Uncharacterized protein n=1 Tax=Artomyces pyxidatus TaxID=48021 RepID=A0ACB8TIL5_9AGAM|nr:hypothetical protein BV25DRAFT_539364 [Artomyces pyxidatus]